MYLPYLLHHNLQTLTDYNQSTNGTSENQLFLEKITFSLLMLCVTLHTVTTTHLLQECSPKQTLYQTIHLQNTLKKLRSRYTQKYTNKLISFCLAHILISLQGRYLLALSILRTYVTAYIWQIKRKLWLQSTKSHIGITSHPFNPTVNVFWGYTYDWVTWKHGIFSQLPTLCTLVLSDLLLEKIINNLLNNACAAEPIFIITLIHVKLCQSAQVF